MSCCFSMQDTKCTSGFVCHIDNPTGVPDYEDQVLCVISTTRLEYLTVKIKEDFELVIEVCVFLGSTIIKFVSCPDPTLLNFLGHAACTIKTSVT